MSSTATPQPDWDLTPYFAALESDDFGNFRSALFADLDDMLVEVAELGPIAADVGAWAGFLARAEDVTARARHLESYLGCVTAAESANELAQREAAQAAHIGARIEKLFVAVGAALKVVDDATFETLIGDPRLEGTRYYVSRLRERTARTMDPSLEGLSADLAIDGLGAWGRLYEKVSGNLMFELAVPGKETRTLPVAMTRSLLQDPDQAVRDAAQAGAVAAWESVGDTVASCLNAISGTRLTLYARRGVEHFLDPALFDAGITRKTLETMWEVVRSRQDVARRFLLRKARLLGKERLAFHDRAAPLPSGDDERIDWEDATARVRDAFASSYPDLAEFAQHAFDRRWVDYAPRPAKRPGGFCTSSPVLRESRIFMTYNGAMGDVQTLAHELGHGFHNWLMRDMRWWQRRYPMTLAETASTFAEQLVTDAVLESPSSSDATKAAILDTRLQDAEAFLLNIPMRFDFEYELYERRPDGELSVSELKAMVEKAQRKSYGDSLAGDQLDPWFWAWKLHFYITDLSFYNFPYTFGYLFSTGLFAAFKDKRAAFLPQYEALLRNTGNATAEEVARESLGVDLSAPDYWNASIDHIEKDLAHFEALTGSD